jgi:putative hydrolase of the HAD superfamily
MCDAILFDLDNTLFDVKQYMTGAFADVAAHLEAEYGIDGEQVHTDLMELWRTETSMYPHLFDDIVADRSINADIDQIVAIFNDHEPALEPYKGVPEILNDLQQTGYTLGIVTDGTPRRQRRKMDALGVRAAFEAVVLTAEVGESKPSPIPFKRAANRLDRRTEDCMYVGDNPRVDFAGANSVGMTTIRLRRGEFRAIPAGSNVDVTIENIRDIYDIISDCSR